jgi:hypothetical protein
LKVEGMTKLLDTYSFRARLQPALFALLPALIAAVAWVPALYDMAGAVVSLGITCGATMLLAQFARLRGRKVEERLFSLWGGSPSTVWLRHRDRHLDAHTKARYHACLAQRIPGWQAPTCHDEHERPSEADALYESATRWLRESTRDRARFAILFYENVNYGFRRNLYGLKATGIVLAVFAVAFNGSLLIWQANLLSLSVHPMVTVVALASAAVALAIWSAIITPEWVRDASDAYARALLAACDELSITNHISNIQLGLLCRLDGPMS